MALVYKSQTPFLSQGDKRNLFNITSIKKTLQSIATSCLANKIMIVFITSQVKSKDQKSGKPCTIVGQADPQ